MALYAATTKTTVAFGFLLVGVGLAIFASSIFIMLPLLPNQCAFGTFPGENGQIAFSRDGQIYVMNTDGSDQHNISNNVATADQAPGWGTHQNVTPSRDTTPPVITVPEDIVVEATSEQSAQVTYAVTAEDNVDGNATLEEDGGTITQDNVGGSITISCNPASGSMFQVGDTEVKCSATDAAGNVGTASFTVRVNPLPQPEPIQTVLTLNTITTNVPWGKDVTVTGKLVNASNSAEGVGGRTITFDGTGAENLPDVITNTDGTFTAKGASPNTVATGWKVQAHFAGDSDYAASNSDIKRYSTLKHSVKLVVSATPSSSIPWGEPTSFTATLTDTSLDGVPISGKRIHFDGTGVIGLADETTNSAGIAIGTGTAPKTVAPGWTYQAHFVGGLCFQGISPRKSLSLFLSSKEV